MSSINVVFPANPGSQFNYNYNQYGFMAFSYYYVSEGNAQVPFPKCHLKQLKVNISSNTLAGGTTTGVLFQLRVNGASVSGKTIYFDNAETGEKTLDLDLALENGDLVCLETTIGGTSGTITIGQGVYVYE